MHTKGFTLVKRKQHTYKYTHTHISIACNLSTTNALGAENTKTQEEQIK